MSHPPLSLSLSGLPLPPFFSCVAMLERMSRRSRSLLSLTLTTLALALSILALCTSYWCEGTHKVVKPLCLSPVKMKNCGQNNSEPYTTGMTCFFLLFFLSFTPSHQKVFCAALLCSLLLYYFCGLDWSCTVENKFVYIINIHLSSCTSLFMLISTKHLSLQVRWRCSVTVQLNIAMSKMLEQKHLYDLISIHIAWIFEV